MKFDEFSTSTPQRRLAKWSGPLKFDAIPSFWNCDYSLSFLRTTETAVYDTHVITVADPRPSIELTRAEEMLLQPVIYKSSTVKRSGKKMSNNRRRRMSTAGAQYKRPAFNKHQINRRREKRIDAFSKGRKLIDDDSVWQSIKPAGNNATFLIDSEPENDSILVNESYLEQCEIDAFQNEIDRLQVIGSTSLNMIDQDDPINENDENTNFEQFCNTKSSEHPYDDTDLRMVSMDLLVENNSNSRESAAESVSCKTENEENNNTMPFSTISSLNTTSTTAKANSHCTHTMYLHPHKIPQIVRHKSLARISLNSEENTSTRSKLISEFNNLHPAFKYYLVGITVAFFSILIYVSRTN